MLTCVMAPLEIGLHELAASASVCLGSAAPVRLESASVSVAWPPAFPTPTSRPSSAFLWSNGNSVRNVDHSESMSC